MKKSPYWKDEYTQLSKRIPSPPLYTGTPVFKNEVLQIIKVNESKESVQIPVKQPEKKIINLIHS